MCCSAPLSHSEGALLGHPCVDPFETLSYDGRMNWLICHYPCLNILVEDT